MWFQKLTLKHNQQSINRLSSCLTSRLAFSQEDLILVESTRPDGTIAQIMYRNGGTINAAELERLCSKVGRAGSQRVIVTHNYCLSQCMFKVCEDTLMPGCTAAQNPNSLTLSVTRGKCGVLKHPICGTKAGHVISGL